MATPIYRKIKDLIMQEIEDKAANSPIDSERDMAVRFDASRMTVRKAIDELVEEGFLYRDKNKGTFVADRKLLKRNTAAEMLQEEISEFIVMYFNVKDAADIAPILEIDQDDQRRGDLLYPKPDIRCRYEEPEKSAGYERLCKERTCYTKVYSHAGSGSVCEPAENQNEHSHHSCGVSNQQYEREAARLRPCI